MPGQFVGHLGLDYIDGFKWTIQEPLTWYLNDDDHSIYVTVPAGYKTDFNSIPRGLWNIFPPTQYGKASIIHDWLYEGGVITDGDKFRTPPKDEVDGIYKNALAVEGCPWFKRQLMWLGVKSNIRGGHWHDK